MPKKFYVDGYNVIFSTFLRDLELEKARDYLIQFSKVYVPDEVVIVFDGKEGVPSVLSSTSYVRFTRGESADEYIKRAVEKEKDRSRIFVVTNDKSIVGYVRYLGARVMTPDEFMGGPKHRNKSISDKDTIPEIEKKRINEELLELWLKKGGKK